MKVLDASVVPPSVGHLIYSHGTAQGNQSPQTPNPHLPSQLYVKGIHFAALITHNKVSLYRPARKRPVRCQVSLQHRPRLPIFLSLSRLLIPIYLDF
jgi:hypothetical protein